MCTSSHLDIAIRAAADRARARRFWHATIDHTRTLVAAGMERAGDAERYHMAWLSAHVLAARPLVPLAVVLAGDGAEPSRRPERHPDLGPSPASGVRRPLTPAS